MILFKHPSLQKVFQEELHPRTRDLMEQLAAWSAQHSLPAPVVTCIVRDPNDPLEKGRFGWHQAKTAVDLRCYHYSTEQAEKVVRWLESSCQPRKEWELITKVHGTGPHYHIAYRDFRWQAAVLKSQEKPE